MTTQNIIVFVIVAAAAVYVGNVIWRQIAAARKKRKSCGDDCGCGM